MTRKPSSPLADDDAKLGSLQSGKNKHHKIKWAFKSEFYIFKSQEKIVKQKNNNNRGPKLTENKKISYCMVMRKT